MSTMAFDDFDLPEEHQIDIGSLESATNEEPFNEEAFELLKEACILLTTVAGLRIGPQAQGLGRNHAIIVGHYARMIRLAKSLIRQAADGHGGDQQLSITREYMDSISTVLYLLDDPGDGSRYDAYVFDGLIAEREFLKNVRQMVKARGGEHIEIEHRIERSIAATLKAAGVEEKDIPARDKNIWPNAQTRVDLLGPTAYSAYRTGSNAIHGGFADIEKHYLDQTGDLFEIALDPQRFRPQPLLALGLLCLTSIDHYSKVYLDDQLPDDVLERIERLMQNLRQVDALHEAYLTR